MSPAELQSALQALFDEAGIRHFKAREFLTLGASHYARGRAYRLNTPPPPHYLPHIVAIAKVWDVIRRHVAAPIIVLSCYRAPAYNRAIGGVAGSQHLYARAADCTSRRVSPGTLYAEALHLRENRVFSGGLGLYPGFLHVDTRGRNATWIRA